MLEKFGKSERKEYVKQVVAALTDVDGLVRATALEIVSDWKMSREFDKVIKALGDQDSTVRFTAMDTLGDIGDARAIPTLMSFLPKVSDREKASCYGALALLDTGKREKWSQHLLDLIGSSDYTTRSAVAYSILNVWPQEKYVQLLSRLQQALVEEETVAARSSIEGAIEEIKGLMQG